MKNIRITLYGRSECVPCDLLKGMFWAWDIPFDYIDMHDPDVLEKMNRSASEEVCKVNGLDNATVPAVLVVKGDEVKWFSNFGKSSHFEISQMFDDIRAFIG